MASLPGARFGFAGVVLVVACFAQPPASGETGDECTPGVAGCPCNDGLCLEGLECREIGCVDPQCVDGTMDCPCLPAGGCDDGLGCEAGFCKTQGGGDSGTGAGATGTTGRDTSSGTSSPLDDSAGVDVDSGPGSMTSDDGPETSDSGIPPGCSGGTPCPPGQVCASDQCVSPGPYGPCIEGCVDGTCQPDMSGAAEVCSAACNPGCPNVDGLGTPACIGGQCFIPCTIADQTSCAMPMMCVLHTDGTSTVCMWGGMPP